MPYRSYYYNDDGHLSIDLNESQIQDVYQSKKGLLWIDICETNEADGQFLSKVFGFHHLSIEDCVSEAIHHPKIDDFEDHLFIVVHGINHSAESDIVETAELAIFLGEHFVVTNHNFFLYSVDSLAKLVETDTRPMKRGADFFAYIVIDALIDNVLPTIDKMIDFADVIEEEVIRSPQQSTLEAILKLKRSIMRIHRVMGPQRELLNRLSRYEYPIIRENVSIFYRDVYDHIARIEDLGQSLRDRADNALATHLSSVANRQNETMRVLSIVATIFLPLALVAGIYGMNFEHMPELGWRWGYYAVVGFIGLAIIVGTSWFWASKWIAWSRRQVLKVRKPFAVEPEKLIGYISQIKKWPHL